jgi:hypothetical protein
MILDASLHPQRSRRKKQKCSFKSRDTEESSNRVPALSDVRLQRVQRVSVRIKSEKQKHKSETNQKPQPICHENEVSEVNT